MKKSEDIAKSWIFGKINKRILFILFADCSFTEATFLDLLYDNSQLYCSDFKILLAN